MFFLSPNEISFPLQFSIKPTSKIIFVCGKAIQIENSLRSIFLTYAEKYLPNYKYLLAEDFVKNINSKDDFLTLESIMTNYSNCIIIILESPSAFTELGAFAHDDSMSKKILIINDKNFKNAESFVNFGPVAKVNKYSKFKSIYADFNAILASSEDIRNELNRLSSSYKRLDFSNLATFQEKHIERIHWLADFIQVYYPISVKEIIEYLKKEIYKKEDFNIINNDIAILKTIKYIECKKINNTFFIIEHHQKNF